MHQHHGLPFSRLIPHWKQTPLSAHLALENSLGCEKPPVQAYSQGMQIQGVIWLKRFVDKLADKHGVATREVEEVLASAPRCRLVERGDVEGEDLYSAMGQTYSGRYLVVFYIHKQTGDALVVSARDMNRRERKSYGKK